MRLITLCLALLTSVVFAYDIPGAYERVFLWYAREIDIRSGRNPPRIAPNCPGRCSFNQFVAFISDPALNPVPNIVDENDRTPKVTTTITRLQANGLTGLYNFGRILNGAKSTADLITNAVEFTANGGGTTAQQKGIRNAINGIRFYRMVASSDAKIKGLRDKFPGIAIKTDPRTLQLDDGTKTTSQVLNIGVTKQSNQNVKGSDIDDVIKSKTDDNHDANTRAASKGLAKLSSCKA